MEMTFLDLMYALLNAFPVIMTDVTIRNVNVIAINSRQFYSENLFYLFLIFYEHRCDII